MPKQEKLQIYLAGPITGCNDEQLHRWRDEVQAKYKKDFNFIDPTQPWEGRTPGVIKVILRQFSRKDSREHVGGLVMESTTPNVLEGKVFDKGEKGSVQTFQIHVQADDENRGSWNSARRLFARPSCGQDDHAER